MSDQDLEGIAIVGMAGRFPGSRNLSEYWDNLKRGVESITVFRRDELAAAGVPADLLANPAYVPASGVLEGIDLFDATFFGFSPREAELTDPQYRLFLEVAWEALENAGYDPEGYDGTVGVFGGMSMSQYLLYNLLPNRPALEAAGPLQTRILNDKDFLTALTAYKLNLTGPSITVQTACSTSLVATCLACQSLMSFQCDLVLAGGVSLAVPHRAGYLAQEGVMSPDGHCRAFDVRAAGTVRGNGVGIVVLKRLADAVADGDTIHAVIKGFATNNDGSFKVGYTAPSVDGQMEAIALAQAVAGVPADTITLIEAHGTGTPLGDPIEVAALREVFSGASERQGYCALGSVKTNIGHLDAAAGVASLIKASLAIRDGILPPSLHCERPNPQMDLENSPFYVNTRLTPWRPGPFPRRAGVSAFSIGGVNAHVVLEEPAALPAAAPPSRPWQVLTLSARSGPALEALTDAFARHLAERPELSLADVAYTCHVGRRPFEHRRVVIARDTARVAEALAARNRFVLEGTADARERQVAFLFPGLGNHYPGMAAGLYRHEPVFRAEVDRCCDLLAPTLGTDLRELLFPAEGRGADTGSGKLDLRRLVRGASGSADPRLLRTAWSQPAVFVIEYALARLWMGWGVRPQALLGFSIGEYVAACLAGVLSLEDALLLVARRAELIERLPDGAMLAVPLGEEEASRLLAGGLALAAVAAPEVSVLAGPPDGIAKLEERLTADGLVCRRLETSHAFHSPLLGPAAAGLEALLRRLELRPPELPFLSNVTGTWIQPHEATDPAYWSRHLLGTVRFLDGVAELLRDNRVLLEVGPGQTLSSWALQCGRGEPVVALASLRHSHDPRSDQEVLLNALGQLWLAGVAPDWRAFHEGEKRRRIPLPTYPFERRRYWLETPDAPRTAPPQAEPAAPPARRPDPADWLYVPSWRQSPVPSLPKAFAPEPRPWLLVHDRHGVGEALERHLRAARVPAIPVAPGAAFRELDRNGFEIDPADPGSWARLLKTLADRGELPGTVVHLAGVDSDGAPAGAEQARALAFDSLLSLAQAVGLLDRPEPLRIAMVTTHLQAVTGEERIVPEKATLLGACATLPQEYPALRCRSIDLPAVAGPGSAATLADQLWAELGSGRSEPVVAYRGGRRWVRHFEPLPLPEAEAAASRLREGGVYLITGGIGGIGLVLAERLARRVRARLVLVGRSGLPPREEWDRLAALPAVPGEPGFKVARLREIEAAGGELLLLRADVADPAEARRIVTAARERWGRIDGVVHAAGVFPGGLAQLKTRPMVDAVFAPKLAGTLALSAALADDPPDFFLLCSSLAGIAGSFGLVDHAAASAFLDAYAHAGGLSPRTFTLAVSWDSWLEVGQAAQGAQSRRGSSASVPEIAPGTAEPAGHPFLDFRGAAPGGQTVFQSRLSTATHWVMDEHRLEGDGLLPGTAYLEMIRAAVERQAGPGPVEVEDLVFAQPLRVPDGETREVRVVLAAEGGEVRILSRAGSGGPWEEHARCRARRLAGAVAGRHDLAEIRSRCRVRELSGEHSRPEGPMRFGARWQGLFERVHLGAAEGLAFLRLAPELAADLESLALHPALLDGAIAFGLALAGTTGSVFLPLAYERAVILGPLPAAVASHMSLRGEAGAEALSCDVTVMDREGVERLRVEGFTMRRLREAPPAVAPDGSFDVYGEGLLPDEGADLFERLLSTAVTSPQVVISLRDLERVLEIAARFDRDRLLEHAERRSGGQGRHPRPKLSVAYAEPGSETEALLAEIWGQILGLDRVGVQDNFFDLGGDSLLATRLVSILRRELGARLTLSALFESPTVAELAPRVEEARDGGAEGADSAAPPLVPVPRQGPLPLSFAQQRLWFIDQLEPGSPLYNIPEALRAEGPLEARALALCFGEIVRRHEALRTVFAARDGAPVQVIRPPEPFRLAVADLSGLPEGRREAEVSALAGEEALRPFDLARDPMLRGVLLRLTRHDHILAMTLHHIASDAWSLGLLVREVAALYPAFAARQPSPLPELPLQYADFAAWQRSWLRGEVLEGEIAFWRRELAGLPPLLTLPTDRPRPAVQSFRGATRPVLLPAGPTERLEALARREGATLFMVLLAGFQILLTRYSGQEDLAVGSPASGRNRAETEELIGFFVNTLVLRGKLAGEPIFREFLGRVRDTALAAWQHQDVPFEKLVEELAPQRSLAYAPLFQVIFALQNAPVGSLDLEGLRLRPVKVGGTTARFDLTVSLEEHEGGLRGTADFAADLFDGATIERLASHLVTLLEGLAAGPERRLSELPLLSPTEHAQLLASWTGPRLDPFWTGPVQDLLARAAERNPEAPALLFAGETVSYGALRRSISTLAAHLAALGVGPETRVVLAVDPSPEMISGLFGILEAGGAYVPLDPATPPERLARLLAETGAPVVLTQEHHRAAFAACDARVVCLDGTPPPYGNAALPGRTAVPESAAYVIYTSGSTGEPKGVMASHGGLASFTRAMAAALRLEPGDRVLQFASLSFDASAVQIFPPLASGATLVLHPAPRSLAPSEILDVCVQTGVTVLDLPAALWRQWVTTLPAEALGRTAIRAYLTGGEAVPTAVLREWAARTAPGASFFSSYGPTEATVTTTAFQTTREGIEGLAGAEAPLGRPLPNTRLALLDRSGRMPPQGAPGEIYIGGAGVTRGYLHEPGLTAAKFVPDPLAGEPGARLYRTGDLARLLPTGELEFLGRGDHQVKIRGYRIELGEIEAALTALPGVREAAVVVHQERFDEEPGDRRLVAYVVGDGDAGSDSGRALRLSLRERLPDYLVPAAFVMLPALPLLPNGKLDRKALPAPRWQSAGDGDGAPRTPVEEVLARIWAEVLGVEKIGVSDHFFDLGGHSLLATQVMSRLRAAFGIEMPLRDLFAAPRLADLAARIEAAPRAGGAPPAPPLVPVPREGPLPLSFAQQRLWFIDQLEPDSPLYNISEALRVEGPLEAGVLALCLGEIAGRHEILRTVFLAAEGSPVQVVQPAAPFPLPVVDLSELPERARETLARTLTAEEAARPFDLRRGPLLRGVLMRLAEEDHVALLTLHHIVSDGWSMGLLVREIAALYPAFATRRPSPLAGLPVQYADFAVWQRSWLQGELLESEISWWRRQLDGLPPLLTLPTDRPRPAVRSDRGATRPVRLPAGLTRELEALARSEGATLFMALLAGFQALLARYSGQNDLAVGSPIAGRNRAEIEGLIGFFVNTLVLRGDLTGGPSLRELLGRARETALAAYAHQDVPFERLVEELAPERSLTQTPLFQVMLVLQNAPMESLDLRDLRLRPVGGAGTTASFDLTFTLAEHDGGLHGTVEHSTDLFDTPSIDRLAGHFERLLRAAVATPELSVLALPFLSEAERHQLLAEWGGTEAEPAEVFVHHLFEAQARRDPTAAAVVWGDQRLSYGELDRRAGHLARRLRAAGVGPESRVAICAERSPDQVVALLAVLKAGGAYLPLDPSSPRERLRFLLRDAQVSVLLAHGPLLADLPVPVPLLELGFEAPDGVAPAPSSALAPENLAYIVYTSGSTGEPKGVLSTHRGLANACLAWQARFGNDTRRHLQTARFSFDVFTGDVVRALCWGACLVLCPEETLLSPADLHALLLREEIDHVDLVPSVLLPLLDHLEETGASFPPVRRALVGSDAWRVADRERLGRLCAPQTRVINAYGVSESSVDSTAFDGPAERLAPGANVPIGVPLAGTRVHVLDPSLRLVPVGVAGELCIGGAGLARGYLGRPGLTAERFVPDPSGGGSGGRLYRTGDRVRRLSDGSLDFLGRLDHQVKLRGFRIEPGEIEALLVALDGVREAVVVAREDRSRKGPGGQRLVAYVTGEGTAGAFRERLRERLPDYMVPAAFVILPALPLTPNGKVDRKALPAPEWQSATDGDVAPRTPVEEVLAGIWAELLGLEQVGAAGHFFDLGGHSLLATQVLSRLRGAFGVEMPLRHLFEAPVLADLAARVEEALRTGAGRLTPPLAPARREGPPPLSFAQQRLWFIDQLEPGSPVYNIPVALRIAGPLDAGVLALCLGEVVRRHEALRTTFAVRDDEPVQVIRPAAPFPLPIVDLSGLPENRREAAALDLAGEEARRPFDLASGPLLRGALMRLAGQDHLATLTLHHIVSDGWSIGILVREVAALYAAFAEGRPSPLPELPVQYADFSVWQRSWLHGEALESEISFWRRQLAGLPPRLELPTDRPRPAVQSFRGASRPIRLPAGLTGQARDLSRREGGTLFMVLLAGFQALLARYSGQQDLAAGTPIAGRNRMEIEGLIGFFVNTLVMRGDLAGGPSFRELLGRVRETTLAAYMHQDVPFEKLVEELSPERTLAHAPLFQVMFALQNAPFGSLEIQDLLLQPVDAAGTTAKFDLTLALGESDGGLGGIVEYATDLFDSTTLDRLIGHYENLLLAALTAPEPKASELELFSRAERHQFLAEWNDTAVPLPQGLLLHRLFAAQAASTPDALAALFEGEALTYAELGARVDRLARDLQGLGCGAESRVGVALERNLDLLVAFLGVLAAGATYIPLDTTYPRQRLADLLDDAGPAALLTQESLRDRLPIPHGLPVLTMEALPEAGGALAPGAPDELGDSLLAYIIYTSGSTGRPKGAMVTHAGMLNHLWAKVADLGLGPHSRIAQTASQCFDISVWQLLAPLVTGGSVHIAGASTVLDPGLLLRFVASERITVLEVVPSLLSGMLDALEEAGGTIDCSSLEWLIVTGEACAPELASRWLELAPHTRLLNAYGPTECSDDVTHYAMAEPGARPSLSLPIGRPLANTFLYVLDPGGRPVAPGVAGELCVAGRGVGRGYLGRPAQTAQVFVPDALSGEPGSRLYRTGDLTRWRADGTLEFFGRLDHQVKVRGFRIELGEIEAVLRQHAEVREAVAVVHEDAAGDPRLLAYVVPDRGGVEELAPRLRQALRERLPEYMVPAAFVILPALPLTPNGKVDRKNLPVPEWQSDGKSPLAPRTPIEEILAGIWAELLGLDRVGAADHFFDLGGHSLLATRVMSRLRNAFNVEMPLRDLFEAPTLAGLAARVDEALRAGLGRLAPPLIPIAPTLRDGALPLSFAQQRLWFIDQLQPGTPLYNIPVALRVEGPLAPRVLEICLGEILRRHEALRTVFAESGGSPVQVIQPAAPFRLPVVDLSDLPESVREALALALAGEEAGRPFDLARGPLLRAVLLRLAGEDHVAALTLHHIAGDGWSMGILIREVTALYGAFAEGLPSPLPDLPVQYADFAAWQRSWLHGEVLESEISYWRRQLAGLPPLLELPTDRPRPAMKSFRGSLRPVRLPAGLTGQAQALSRRDGATSFMVLLAGLQSLLARSSGQEDLAVGTPLAGRNRVEIEGLIGFFVNTLVLRGDLSGDPTFRELLGRVRETALAAHAHQDVPFERLIQELAPERSLAHTPLFQVMLALQNAPVESLEIRDLRLRTVNEAGTTAKFDLLLSLEEHHGGLRGTVEYATELFDGTTIDRLVRQYERLLAAALAAPELKVSDLPLLSPAERQHVLVEWNDTLAARPEDALIHELFEGWVRRTPGAVAAVFGEESLTYGELEAEANRLAHHLVSLGVGPGSLVGIHLRRSLPMLPALLATLKAGAAYVPLEIGHPLARLERILGALEISCLLTESAQLATVLEIQAGLSAPRAVVCLDRVGLEIYDRAAPPHRSTPDDLAYIIFTSGSTGTPKGVMVRHRPVVNLLRWACRSFAFSPADRVLFVTSLSFDLSVFDIFGLLGAGGSIRIATEEEIRDPQRLLRALACEPITFWDSAPAALEQTVPFLAGIDPQARPALRLVFLSGDWIPVTLPDRLRERFPGARVVSLGGATEATVWSNVFSIDAVDPAWPSIPYGRPIDNARYHVLDARLEPCPVGVPGDLYIGGDCLADGYAREPELTAGKFLPDPWSAAPGARLYRTGDRARYRPDGNLEFLGRRDHQVKIRGFRIELGEIEAALANLPGVRDAVVVVWQDRSEGGPGDRRLVAYVVGDVAAHELRAALRERLPDYMVPAVFVRLAALPLTSNGKVDRKALPAPAPLSSTGPVEESRSPLEETLAGIWSEVLGVPRVGFEENFFDLGGHSLLLTRVQARLRDRLERDISLVELLTHTTVRALARHLETREVAPAARAAAAPGPDSGAIAIVGLSGRFPGAANVERLWANLCAGISSIARFSDEELAAAGVSPALRRDPRYVPAGGALDGVDLFDADFFGYSPREAEILNPQHRLFLECAWEALEDAGYDSRRVPGPVGLFAGLGFNTYLYQVFTGLDPGTASGLQMLTGNDKDFLPTRVSYKLDLKGPSLAVQTACSSSLVAVHLACQNLRLGACDMALAGGISIGLPQRTGYLYEEGGIDSPDGCCRAFDAEARGTVRGSGVGIVVLKRLGDALAQGDTIRAVLRGSAVNNDGSGKAGYMAPSVAGQDEVIRRALAEAGVDPATIDYVEAHGTGTVLGDPIEVQALARAFRRGGPRERSCALGSVKSNLGHLDTAAGVTGLIKATLALQHGLLPPSLGFSRPNPHIDFAAGPFHVQTELTEWERGSSPRRAGVSSFGIGGTNAHAVLEEAPAVPPSESTRPWHLLVLSARAPAALEKKRAELADHLSRHPEIHPADAAYTLQLGRRAFSRRLIAVARDSGDAAAVLRGEAPERLLARTAPETAPPVVFLFPGQGSQRPGMGTGLYRTEPLFQSEIDRSCEILLPDLGFDLRELLLAPAGSEEAARRLAATEVTQPALFVLEHALARLFMEWGVRPQALIGHSLGEYVAACLAGVFSLEDALGLVAARGRLVGSLPPGAMLAVSLPAPDAARRAEEHGLAVAAVNAAGSSVLSGPAGAVEQLAGQLAAEGIEHRPLRTSHAFHSAALEPILDRFRDEVAQRELRPPLLPWVSNLSGTWIRPEEATDPGYWTRHLRETVRFAEGVEELSRVPGRVYLEVGPGRSLSSLVRRSLGRSGEGAVIAALPRSGEPEDDLRQGYEALGRLWLAGVEIDWSALQAPEKRRRVPLPTYPFERRRYWVEARPVPQAGPPEQVAERRDPASPFSIPLWRQSPVPPSPAAGVESRPWLLVQDPHGIGEALQERLRAAGVPAIPVGLGATFRETERNGFEIDPGDAGSWARLLAALAARGELPGTVVHLAGVDGPGAPMDAEPTRAPALESLLGLARAVGLLERPEPLRIATVTTHLQAVTGEECVVPEKAALLGACATLPHTHPTLRCRSIDLPPVAGSDSAEALAGVLWTELTSGHDEAVVAYRGGRRWVRHLEPLLLPEAAATPSRLREGGVYLITGGAGRTGLALAEWLAKRVKARLALADRWFQAAPLREIEAAGGEVLPWEADVADPQQVRQAVAAARERWGHIDGVVHAADGGFAAKLTGTRNLAAALADDPPGFLLLCSSPGGTTDASAQINDAAANAFLDAYAQAGGLSPRTFTFAVSWDGWPEGTDTFERLLSTAVTSPQVAVSFRSPAPWPASSADLDREGLSEPAEHRDRGHGLHPRPDLTVYSEPGSGPGAFLASLWAQMLGFDRVSAHDNFFDLGGDSLLAVRLMAQIEHDFGVKLPISALLEAPTVERLAALLHHREAPDRRSPLVRLHPGGTGRPLFMLPPVGGDVFAYVDLAHRLGVDRPVYGLQTVIPTGRVGENGHHPTMEELSAQALAAVREVQAEGPWLLAGWSFGAVAAYEMAQQIESSGGTVALLAMIDPFAPPDGHSEEANDVALLRSLAVLGQMIGAQVQPELIRLIQETVAGLDVDAELDRIAELARAEGALPPDLDKSWLRERFDLVSRNLKAMEGYLPLPYGGRVTLFRAGASLAPGAADLTLGWGTLARTEAHLLDADHDSLLRRPALDRLVELLQSDLTEAENGPDLHLPLG